MRVAPAAVLLLLQALPATAQLPTPKPLLEQPSSHAHRRQAQHADRADRADDPVDVDAPAAAASEHADQSVRATTRRRLSPWRLARRTLTTYGVVTLLLSPFADPSRVGWLLRQLRAPAALGRVVDAVLTRLYTFRSGNTVAVLVGHEIFTDISADIIAQAFAAAPTVSMVIDWRRVVRSASSSLVSDDLPFLLWSNYIWHAGERVRARLRASSLSPRLAALLTSSTAVAVGKTAVTQLVYETTSNALYLALQSAMRGGGLRGVVAELKQKLLGVWLDGLLFWSVAHIVVFSLPAWWLQPVADNFFTLIFNTYLAVVSYR